jgi:hypothetical protein
MRASLSIVAVLVCGPIWLFGQGIRSTPIALTDKITSLDGVWAHDPAKGVFGRTTIDETIRISVSAQGVKIESSRPAALLPLDGSLVKLRDTAFTNASLDAGWLAVTIRVDAPRQPGVHSVYRDVYIAAGDELRIWRTFNIELPDGSLSQTISGANREVVVYRRQRQ